MAGGLDRDEAIRLVNLMLGVGSPATTVLPIQVRLCTTTPTATANGTEVSGNPRQNFVTASSSPTPAAAASGTGGATSNSAAAITFAGLPAVGGAGITHIELWDSAGTPKRKMWGPLGTARVVAAGDSLVFATSQIVASIGV